VTNAANFATVTGFVPGEIITFFGSNLGPAQIQYSTVDATGHFGNTIAGCQVIINGVAAPMIYASANQTSAITPYEVAPNITNAQTVMHESSAMEPAATPGILPPWPRLPGYSPRTTGPPRGPF
jgi:uncharacterized protein (TIGR03437 family)